MTIVLTMIDEVTTIRGFKRASILVRDHITSNVDPDLNGVLVNALLLKCVTLTAKGMNAMDAKALAADALATYRTNPPAETVCPVCGDTYMWHVEYRYTCPKGHHWSATQPATVGGLR